MSIRILCVDDSAVARRQYTDYLGRRPELEIVGTAPDPWVAREKLIRLKPDVVVLDVEMPGMDGLTFLRRIMQFQPTPVVVVSSLGTAGGQVAMEALASGAADVMAKAGPGFPVETMMTDLAHRIVAVAGARMGRAGRPPSPRPGLPSAARPAWSGVHGTAWRLVVIGASTGGPQALEEILCALPAQSPPILIVQHMPETFTAAFAARLNGVCAIEVREAVTGDTVRPGLALIARGGLHLAVQVGEDRMLVSLRDGPRVNGHRPSVDVLFKSVARAVGAAATAVLLTGMGVDGAAGMAELRAAGADTIAQDEATSVVFGMAREAAESGAVGSLLPLERIAGAIMASASRPLAPCATATR